MKITALLLILLGFVSLIQAEEAKLTKEEEAKLKAVEAFFEASKVKEKYEVNLKKYVESVKSSNGAPSFGQQGGEKSQAEKDIEKKIGKLVEETLAWEKVKKDYIKLYSDDYTTEELDELTKFYTTKLGKKYAENELKNIAKSDAISDKHFAKISAEVDKIVADAVQDMMQQFMGGGFGGGDFGGTGGGGESTDDE